MKLQHVLNEVRFDPIIAIYKTDIFPFSRMKTSISARRDARISLMQHMNTFVLMLPCITNRWSIVRRTVIDKEYLNVVMRLLYQ